ncbi:MAG: four-helix bundle copper-binding protein [Hyphomicrobiales bacterium]|nr:MAG: four-helix bundle copper-binding protein [Hyphomicrobiales bacterium]
MHQVSPEMRACIDECLRCYSICLSTAMGHCLEAGRTHVEKKHFTLMMSCAEICRTSAHFMLLGSEHHAHICGECAEICAQCADDCDRLGNMPECVEACRRCAESCRKMAS